MEMAKKRYEKLKALFEGIELTDLEERYLEWISNWDNETADTIASLFMKIRGADKWQK